MALVEEMRSLAQDILHSVEDRARAIGEIKGETTHFLSQAHEARETLGQELRGSLAQDFSRLQSEGRELRGSLAQETSQRKSDVGAMLRGFRAEQAGARDEWRKLTATMQAKRKRGNGALAEAGAQTGPETPALGALPDQAFRYLANRPNGAKMTELEQALGAPRIQMAKALKSLVEANKVKKQGLLYSAA